jgi:hypothetical protein
MTRGQAARHTIPCEDFSEWLWQSGIVQLRFSFAGSFQKMHARRGSAAMAMLDHSIPAGRIAGRNRLEKPWT